jgi:hypothetical protein
MALAERFDVRVRCIPFQMRLKGKGERSVDSEYKVKYSYMDAPFGQGARSLEQGPLKTYDMTPAAIGGLFAGKHGRLLDYGREPRRRHRGARAQPHSLCGRTHAARGHGAFAPA